MRKFLDRTQSALEYLVSLAFAISGLGLMVSPTAAMGEGFLVAILGGTVAMYIYAVWFIALATSLTFSKVCKKKRIHKNTLLAMYLTSIYTSVLLIIVYGLGLAIVDDVVIGILTAVFWLRWTFKTEYINPKEFQKTAEKYREDLS